MKKHTGMGNALATRALGLFAAGAMALTLGGCPPCGGNGDTALETYHFEGDCTDSLCGFTATSGAATRVDAFTAGEHAMRLEAGTEVDQAYSLSVPYGPEYVRMVARCDEGAHIEVDELLSDSTAAGGRGDAGADSGRADGGTGGFTPPRLRAAEVTLEPGQGWSSVRAVFPRESGEDAGVGTIEQNATLTDLRIRAVGGACTVDEISYGYSFNAACGE